MIPLFIWWALAALIIAIVLTITAWLWIPVLIVLVAVLISLVAVLVYGVCFVLMLIIGGCEWIWTMISNWDWNRRNKAQQERLDEIMALLRSAKKPEDIMRLRSAVLYETQDSIRKRWRR